MLFRKAHLLKMLDSHHDAFRVSLYADDVTLFMNPTEHELLIINHILQLFAKASWLITNIWQKHNPIPYNAMLMILSSFQGLVNLYLHFPVTIWALQ
jgi:hypothetical protein